MSTGKWDDLAPRLFSAVAMVALGALGVWLGGLWFHALIAIVVGLMVWELVTMLDTARSKSPMILAVVSALVSMTAIELPASFALPLLLMPSMLGLGRMERGGVTYAVFTAFILLAGYGLMALRDDFGLTWMVWLLLVVVVTDIAGYFAGRLIGGPKLWPRVSPKKTWSGTVAGWAGSAVVALLFASATRAGIGLIGVSIAVSMASQIGDIAESAIKRRAGVKDSSQLIPGHGGLLDRFDGMLGAALFIVIAGQLIGFPPGSQ
ncbi:phosphatidate cytidylyltransferase [Marivita sp. XM-24bin2]|jgi:phosphatidate cytidylyltransferase|uniref:phosphatidate cytidylyltransferase n=1 Tax=unclassified Marivita TaxID=2632480 RepID=UPI000D79E103|nr:phosphatidate cytidylyltransferase [Marivita sp. XM-24bin2]MCR9109284.1 phosphatidate cytidylyltransferase [Paracoccaceae bacterium]PWL34469.1 MAG: phosphatidate cytidylyltransferase [Marivita sp. XM-24bin2]